MSSVAITISFFLFLFFAPHFQRLHKGFILMDFTGDPISVSWNCVFSLIFIFIFSAFLEPHRSVMHFISLFGPQSHHSIIIIVHFLHCFWGENILFQFCRCFFCASSGYNFTGESNKHCVFVAFFFWSSSLIWNIVCIVSSNRPDIHHTHT